MKQKGKNRNIVIVVLIIVCLTDFFSIWRYELKKNVNAVKVFCGEWKMIGLQSVERGEDCMEEGEFVMSAEQQNTLNVLLTDIHKSYIYSQWFMEDYSGIPNSYTEDKITLNAKDLEEVAFYEDGQGAIYFIPISMVNKKILLNRNELQVYEYNSENQMDWYLYSYETYELELERAIYPEPEKWSGIFPRKVNDFIEELQYLGMAKVPFPSNIPAEAAYLYENEYTDSVVDIIHAFFYNSEKYGEYQIYFGRYIFNKPEYENHDYKFLIEVAIVGQETSYYWIFRAKDGLGVDGHVILESNGGLGHSFPAEYDKDNYNYYAPLIDGIIHADRLVIPISVKKEDSVKELDSFKDEDDSNTIHYFLKE